uniref:Peptidase A1 domain-containing protein n=1 Tax=Ditylenchus dipsaci TaxID=166011 RepID=A0A915CR15_9BILA
MQSLAGQLDENLYSLWIQRKSKPEQINNPGQITLGARDSLHCGRKWNSVKLIRNSSWTFHMDGLTAGRYTSKRKKKALSNPSQALILGPSRDIKWIAQAINATMDESYGLYRLGCEQKNLPDIVFNIGGVDYTIPPVNYVSKYANFYGDICFIDFLAIDGWGYTDASWVFGTPLTRSYCTTYNFANKTLEFAENMRR